MAQQPASFESKIEALRPGLSGKQQKRLRLDTVLRMARRLDAMADHCDTCTGHRLAMDQLIARLDSVDSWQLSEWKAYYHSLDGIIKHLKSAHGLIEENDNLAVWMALGTGIGAALGAAFGNIGLGVALGVSGGLAFGSILDAVAHKQGRVI